MVSVVLAQISLSVDWNSVASLITFRSILLLLFGVILGLVVGSVPGLSGSLALALAIPFTINLDALGALALLIGIYKGSMFGGAMAAIAFGIPGTPSSAPTVLDGYPMTQKGYPKRALITAHYSGVSADIFSDIVLILTFAPLAVFALRMGPREMFALMVMALAILATFAGVSIGRALIGVGVGLILATVGTDPISGNVRMNFGIPYLRGGIGIMPLIVGLFAMSEIMVMIGSLYKHRIEGRNRKSREVIEEYRAKSEPNDHLTIREWVILWRETLTGAITGTIIGAIPGPGATLASYTSYGIAQGYSRNRGKFGKGEPGGVAAAEAADSATAGSTLVPLFGLGIPGSVMAALFAGALQIQGITPGPGMLRTDGDLIYAIFISLMLGSVFMLVVVHYIIPVYGAMSLLNVRVMIPVLTVLSVLGVYAATNSAEAVILMVALGTLGYILRANQVPLGAVVMAIVIGPPLEANLRRGLLLSGGEVTYWFEGSLAPFLYLMGGATAIYLYRTTRMATISATKR